MNCNCLSIRQPYASAIICGEKTIEIRSWKTEYRGPLVICSSGGDFKLKYDDGTSEVLPGGYALGVVQLTDIRPLKITDGEAAWFEEEDWEDLKGQYAWVLENPLKIVPVKVKGQLRIYKRDIDIKYIK